MEDDSEIRYGIIEYFGLTKETGRCGYCKTTRDAGNTYGLWAHILPVRAYQNLIDRNWRRCGKYVYKPVNDKICCPMYTIRCDATKFRLSNSQKKVLKRFNAYILNDQKPNNRRRSEKPEDSRTVERFPESINNIDSTDGVIENICKSIIKKKKRNTTDDTIHPGGSGGGEISETANLDKKPESTLKSSKKKFLRRKKLVEKVMRRNGCSEEEAKKILFEKSQAKQKTKTLEEFLGAIENATQAKHRFRTEIISKSIINEEDKAGFEVFAKYQMTIHKEKPDEVTYPSYKRFLIDTPFELSLMNKQNNDYPELPRRYGPYHQHYYIDDRLVAVGVIDILPGCISSVYLFYDPEFSFLDLGVYSALTEIALIRKYASILPELKYYYMGYYIHSCPKMRYKARYRPSDLLCPETFRWFDIDRCLLKLNQNKYARFCDDPGVIDDDGNKIQFCDIKIYFKETVMSASDIPYLFKNRKLSENLQEYARLVGRKCINALLYFVS